MARWDLFGCFSFTVINYHPARQGVTETGLKDFVLLCVSSACRFVTRGAMANDRRTHTAKNGSGCGGKVTREGKKKRGVGGKRTGSSVCVCI